MRMEKFTAGMQLALSDAQTLAVQLDHNALAPLHVLKVLLEDPSSRAVGVLRQMGIDLKAVSSQIAAGLSALPKVNQNTGDLQASPDLMRWFNLAQKRAAEKEGGIVSDEHLLQALFDYESDISRLLSGAGLNPDALERAIHQTGNPGESAAETTDADREALERYTVDLTEQARAGKLDPVIGRDAEIRRAIQVLQRRTKNNPVLIGAPGVGKTAIVEGLAIKIFNGDCPRNLMDKRIVSLDMTSIVAGTKYRGQFEERMKVIIEELQNAPSIIVFISWHSTNLSPTSLYNSKIFIHRFWICIFY